MTQDADGAYHRPCEWCGIDVVNPVGPPFMSFVTGTPAPEQDTIQWAVCLDCYTDLIRLIANIQKSGQHGTVLHALRVLCAAYMDRNTIPRDLVHGAMQVIREAEGKPVRDQVAYDQVVNAPVVVRF